MSYLKGDKAPYWFNEYLRHIMKLMDNCREKAMENFSATSRVDMNESTWCSKSLQVSNKWLDRGSSYHKNTERLFQELVVNVDYCLDNVRVEDSNAV